MIDMLTKIGNSTDLMHIDLSRTAVGNKQQTILKLIKCMLDWNQTHTEMQVNIFFEYSLRRSAAAFCIQQAWRAYIVRQRQREQLTEFMAE